MAEPIPYIIKSGDTYSSIAKKLGLKDWIKLKSYHNDHADFNHQVGNTLYANTELLTPPPEDVAILNGDAQAPKDEVKEEQQQEEQKQQEEKKKQEEEKKQEQAAKGEHDGKYFVVHGAKCVCDKAENPKQTADLQVTSHNIIVLNDQSKKYLATEEDKTFIPPAATFGKCTLKPSSGGYLPCALAPAPKWDKAYESTQVQGKKSLTEISELKCMVGGKITIEKHGQTDSVTNAHADNTNPLELAMVNPAVEQPKKKTDYPSVSSISINQIENRQNFKPKNSKIDKAEFPVIYLRKGEEAKFEAQLSKGNKQLTSWVVYNDHKGSKENRILVRAQIGTEFSQSFEQYGKYRVEGYGKPKSPDFEKGKYDKCDPSCSIDIEVIENVLYELETNDFGTPQFTRVDAHKKRKFRQNFLAEFKAKFHISPSVEEKLRLKIYVLDGAGNVLTGSVQNGIDFIFTPRNSNAKYTIVAEYTTEAGEKIIKQISGETESNTVVSITHGTEVIRPNTSLTFSVNKMRYSLLADDPVSNQEVSEVKWNLNGKLIGTGRSITIPGNMLLTPQKYVVEAFCKMANAFGSKAKHEEDDWHFEVKENDVVSFSLSGTPKVGKPVTVKVDKMIFPDLKGNEVVRWEGLSSSITGNSIVITPRTPGILHITSKINNRKGVTQDVKVIQATINNITFTDSQGNKIEKASWGQDINLWMEQSGLEGEKLNIILWDDDLGPTDDPVKTIAVDSYNGTLIPITLDPSMKGKTGNHGEIYIKVSAPELIAIGEGKDFPTSYKLDVEDVKEIYSAIIGSADGKEKHTLVDYDEVSYFYAHTRGIKPTENLYLEIPKVVFGSDPVLLYSKNVKVDKSGVIREKIVWNNIKNKVNLLTVYGIVKEKDADGKVLYDADGNLGMAATKLQKGSSLAKQAGYTGAVKVGSQQMQSPSNGSCACQQYDLVWGGHPNVSCEFRKKVVEISKRQNFDPNHLMAVMYVESAHTFSPSKIELKVVGYRKNGKAIYDYVPLTKDEVMKLSENFAGAVGLIQFTPEAITDLNKRYSLSLTKRKLALMTQLDQLDYAEKYIAMWKENNKITTKLTLADLYLVIFSPSKMNGSDDNTILYSKESKYYESNKSVDKDNNGISKKELAIRAYDSFTLGLANKEETFSCGQSNNTSNNATIMSDADIEFHIFSTGGEIQYKIKNEKREIAAYFYHDVKGVVHDIGKQVLKKISNKYGAPYKDRIKDNFVYLIDIRKLKNYKNGSVKYTLVMNPGTNRFFMNDVTLAAFIGAMLDCSFDDFTFNGFSDSEGRSIGGSKSHKNGMNGDLRYLRKDKSGQNVHLTLSSATGDPCGWKGMDETRQNQFNDALYKYGWKSMLSWKFDNGRLLNHCTQYDDHYHHLHVQSFTPNLKEMK